jgi:hypothetical protein
VLDGLEAVGIALGYVVELDLSHDGVVSLLGLLGKAPGELPG